MPRNISKIFHFAVLYIAVILTADNELSVITQEPKLDLISTFLDSPQNNKAVEPLGSVCIGINNDTLAAKSQQAPCSFLENADEIAKSLQYANATSNNPNTFDKKSSLPVIDKAPVPDESIELSIFNSKQQNEEVNFQNRLSIILENGESSSTLNEYEKKVEYNAKTLIAAEHGMTKKEYNELLIRKRRDSLLRKEEEFVRKNTKRLCRACSILTCIGCCGCCIGCCFI